MTIRILFVVIVLATSACTPCPICQQCPPCKQCPAIPTRDDLGAKQQSWFVQRVIDGDTLVVRLEGGVTERTETVRLLNIDTPEKKEPGFVEATEALKDVVRGGYVELEFEKPQKETRDSFGRLLAFVIADDKNANIELVRQGWSAFYTKYGRGRFAGEFEEAQREAKTASRGLWSSAFD